MCRTTNNSALALVEAIVLVVIAVVLVLIAVQLYRGYTSESRRSAAEDLGASAAAYLQVARNSAGNATVDALPDLCAGGTWTVDIDPGPDTSNVIFTCPANAAIRKDNAANTVTATVDGQAGSAYRWR